MCLTFCRPPGCLQRGAQPICCRRRAHLQAGPTRRLTHADETLAEIKLMHCPVSTYSRLSALKQIAE